MKKIIMPLNSEQSQRCIIDKINFLGCEQNLVVSIEKFTKKRSNGQNSMQWVSLLGDFSMQGIIDGRQFSAKIWHEHLKELFLPEQFTPGETMKNYIKWQEMPGGKLKMVGSTTKLTTLGFSNYMEKCYSFGAQELEIKFTAKPGDY